MDIWLVCFGLMVFIATFNNISVISWRSVLLMEETGVSGENHRPATSHWQTVSHNVVSLSVTCGRSVVLSGYSDWHLTICKGSHEAHYKLAIFYNTYSIKNTFSHIVLGFCFVCIRLVYLMLPVSLDCSFWLSLRYSLKFISRNKLITAICI
jgi:hypothetical protein